MVKAVGQRGRGVLVNPRPGHDQLQMNTRKGAAPVLSLTSSHAGGDMRNPTDLFSKHQLCRFKGCAHVLGPQRHAPSTAYGDRGRGVCMYIWYVYVVADGCTGGGEKCRAQLLNKLTSSTVPNMRPAKRARGRVLVSAYLRLFSCARHAVRVRTRVQ